MLRGIELRKAARNKLAKNIQIGDHIGPLHRYGIAKLSTGP
jgi:hypothetical protein